MDRNGSFDHVFDNASIQVLLFQMRPEEKQVQVELEDDEKRIVSLLQANENQMEFGLLKIKSELSGKKWDKAMKNLSSLGMTEVIVVEKRRLVA
jgi:lysyl-tRNA synthetase class 2